MMIGQIINKYKITGEIGKGGMAIVYKGENNDAIVKNRAFKVVRPDKGENNHQLYNRFLNEIEIMGELREHPNIVKAEDVHQHQNTTILEMEYLNGMNLDQYIQQNVPNGITNKEELSKICKRILDALQYAHDRNILHLDIKPNNIFRTYNGWIKLLDFGIAKVVGEKADIIEGAESVTCHTETGESTFKGTLAFSSPEQQAGASVSIASDIFSFGKTLHYIATGSTDMNVECSLEPFARIIDRCTQQKVRDRFQTCKEIIDYIDKPTPPRNKEVKCINSLCGKDIDKGFKFCPYCRTEIKLKVKNCSNCGATDNALDALCCHRCGFDLKEKSEPPPEKKTCKTHKGTYDLADNFCNECGKPLIIIY